MNTRDNVYDTIIVVNHCESLPDFILTNAEQRQSAARNLQSPKFDTDSTVRGSYPDILPDSLLPSVGW